MEDLKVFKHIYHDVFLKIYDNTFYVFLCGGAGRDCIRNIVRKNLELDGVQVFYPEDLFMDMLNRNKKANLLEFENLLADSADAIIIICESIGAAAELGAFVQMKDLTSKIIICVEKKYVRNKSFIMDGPVKYLITKTGDKSKHFINYDKKNLLSTCNSIKRVIKTRRYSINSHLSFIKKDPDFNLIPTYIPLIQSIIYFYQTINRKVLFSTLKQLLIDEEKCPSRYNELFNATIKYLLKQGLLTVEAKANVGFSYNEQMIKLSEKGIKNVEKFLDTSSISSKNILCDKIRCAILKEQLNS